MLKPTTDGADDFSGRILPVLPADSQARPRSHFAADWLWPIVLVIAVTVLSFIVARSRMVCRRESSLIGSIRWRS